MLSKGVHEHTNHEKFKTIINTSDDDQIDCNIIFDDHYVKNNSGTDERDSNAHDQSFDIESLVYNVQKEAENQQRMNKGLKKQKTLLQKELETVASSSSVTRSESKDTNSKKRVLLNTKSKSTVLKEKIVNAVNDRSNLVCVSYGKDVFMLSHYKCVARYTLSADSRGEDFLIGSRDSNLYTISISKFPASSPVCLMSKASSTKSWLWHRRLPHLNFGTINHLAKKNLVDGLLKFNYDKDHICSACEQRKSKKATFSSKLVPSKESKLELIHMDLCGPMRVESINGK
ncbi:integrase, catalytic region, zinc finger, CCHC-type containing protein [Tanacetum coccineum]